MARIDNLEFLSDVIPPTVPFKQIREKKNKVTKDADAGQLVLPGGQKILPIGAPNGSKKAGKGGNGKSKAVAPEADTPVDNATEEEVGENSGEDEPIPVKKGGLERFAFDKNKSRDKEMS